MPHVNGSGGDDLASSDEVKVYKDEGEEEKRSSENLTEEKSSLVTETEDKSTERREDDGRRRVENGKPPDISPHEGPGFYVVAPYPHPNGLGMGMHARHPHSPLFMYNNDHFAQPPPAHMGISPVTFDPKTDYFSPLTGLARPMYHLPPPSQYMYPDPFSQMQWHPSSMYPVASTFRGAYPGSLH
ncbi:PREDICTED: protein pangolin, isoforms A/H/I/S-like, partial [Priapulus caudatus]|uniref:Protein pangolin, isoforms A/H/I/S-like n=1 Tax=Priapulus caudatus TaxID=37621 RepID=A0ABM1ETR8_PRICU